jgi:simple sugar transport system ATP-binding protein
VGETTPAETSKSQLAEMMVGRPVLFRLDKAPASPGEPLLQIEGLEVDGKVNGIDLQVRAGEIVGVAGVEGNGQRELAEAIVGLQPPTAGSVRLAGREISGLSVGQVRNAGLAFIPEDRHEQGLVLDMTVWENAVLGRQDDEPFSSRAGILSLKRMKDVARDLIGRFDVRARGIDVTAGTLSGGNQQKLILARELETDPQILLASQPTRGLDVGAIEFVWREILEQRAEGRGVLLISAELDEIYALSDRIVTIYGGRITGEYGPDAPPEDVGFGMLGGVGAGTGEMG